MVKFTDEELSTILGLIKGTKIDLQNKLDNMIGIPHNVVITMSNTIDIANNIENKIAPLIPTHAEMLDNLFKSPNPREAIEKLSDTYVHLKEIRENERFNNNTDD
jgi:hypothetical protein